MAITNPHYEGDSKLVGAAASYVPDRPILINKIKGNPSYASAISEANNFYTATDNYCFWDNGNSAVNGVGEKGGTIVFNSPAGNLQVTVNANGTLTFSNASASATA
ncbi:MAG TPA: hypothetical protein VI455_12175 [Terriglobia bacterium]